MKRLTFPNYHHNHLPVQNTNELAEMEIRAILQHLEAQNEALEQIHRILVDKSFTPDER